VKEKYLMIIIFAVNIMLILSICIIVITSGYNPILDNPDGDSLKFKSSFIQFLFLFWFLLFIIQHAFLIILIVRQMFFIVTALLKKQKIIYSYLIIYLINTIIFYYINEWSLKWMYF